ncbi:MAG: DUF922 domain-containing Zn-dependent protease [Bacteroidota bacterium]|nr:DUF922 domain-containing Zn-dependent protease [Bacteroidota bacterium]
MVLFKWVYGLLINMLVLNHGCSQSLQKDDQLICWQEGRKLDWSDFQGTPDTIITHIGTLAVAATSAPIRYSLNQKGNVISIKVKVEFLKNISWTTDTAKSVLIHEQLHFDIAELYGRKIREKVANLNKETNIESIHKEVKRLIKERNDTEDQYDIRTGHGIIDFVQQEWADKIAKELEKLKEYATSAEDCEESFY